MPVIKMNVPCQVRAIEGFDGYGQQIVSKPRNSVCAVIKLEVSREQSTVRADSASSRGHAFENRAEAFVLMDKKDPIKLDDILTISGKDFIVKSIRPRYTVFGRLDHLEVKGMIA